MLCPVGVIPIRSYSVSRIQFPCLQRPHKTRLVTMVSRSVHLCSLYVGSFLQGAVNCDDTQQLRITESSSRHPCHALLRRIICIIHREIPKFYAHLPLRSTDGPLSPFNNRSHVLCGFRTLHYWTPPNFSGQEHIVA